MSSSKLQVAVGHSCDPDSESAIQQAIATCMQELDGTIPQAGILLAAADYEHDLLLHRLNQALPDLELIGGSTNSELSSKEGFQQDSLVLVLFSSETIQIRAGIGHNAQRDPEAAVQEGLRSATAQITQPIALCLAFPDGLTTNGSDVVTYLSQALPESLPILGGTTSEQFQYDVTYQFYKDRVCRDAIPILLFAGELKWSCGVSGGWRTIGSKGLVTSASGNTVYEIDRQPARLFYNKYFGELTIEPADNGIAVFESCEERFYFRALQQKYDAQATDLSFLGDIPQGATVQLTQADRDDLFEGAKTAIQQALSDYDGNKPEALLCFSCAGRRMFMGKQAHQEYEVIQTVLPDNLAIAGFYCYGEIAPLKRRGKIYYHNYTFVSLLLGTD